MSSEERAICSDTTIGALLGQATRQLEAASDTARLDAELLLAAVTRHSRASVIAHPERSLTAAQLDTLGSWLRRRADGESVAGIVGSKEFYSLELQVNANVLIPRPETELLVEWILALHLPAGSTVLDVGTGSGAIALALKHERPELKLTAVDCSVDALSVARQNANSLGLDVRFIQSDWFSALGHERFDLIVSNPPYVQSDDPHLNVVGRHEPRLALDGGADGLDAYRSILNGAGKYLHDNGQLVLEHGFDQRDGLTKLAVQNEFSVLAVLDDLAGQHRAVALGGNRHG